MTKKIYASYEEINKDIEILKLEKELNYQKLVLSMEQTKRNLKPKIFSRTTFSLLTKLLWKPLQDASVSFFIKKYFGK